MATNITSDYILKGLKALFSASNIPVIYADDVTSASDYLTVYPPNLDLVDYEVSGDTYEYTFVLEYHNRRKRTIRDITQRMHDIMSVLNTGEAINYVDGGVGYWFDAKLKSIEPAALDDDSDIWLTLVWSCTHNNVRG